MAGLWPNRDYLRCRILARILRFFRPILRRPLPVFLTPISPALPSSVILSEKPRDPFASGEPRIAAVAVTIKEHIRAGQGQCSFHIGSLGFWSRDREGA